MRRLFIPSAGTFMLTSSLLFFAFSRAGDPFFNKTSKANLAEIQAGKLAISKGSTTIKRLGQQMITDYTTAEKDLIKIAKKQNISIVMHLDATHKHLLDSLISLSGKAFDAAYIKCQIADQQVAIAFFKEESLSGINSEVKEYAGKYLPLIKMHLNMFNGDSSAMKMTVDSPKNK
jgi:putative membrane protein